MDRREAEILSGVLGRPVDHAEGGCEGFGGIPPAYREALGRCPGLAAIDKPTGPTSHDVVAALRANLAERLGLGGDWRRLKAGHSGTLDPAASGVLLVAFGRATRLMPFLTGLPKSYRARIRLGIRTDTDDLEGRPVGEEIPRPDVARGAVEAALLKFRGRFFQKTPVFSAVKLGGTPAHRLARSGRPVEPGLREVEISRLEILGFDGRDVELELDCSSGTYVRSLARDIGDALGCGGALAELRRLAVGPFTLKECIRADEPDRIAAIAAD